jgi:hypothetical protein
MKDPAPELEKGRHEFSFTYDDTGETAEVAAPNGWTIQRMIDEAYIKLEETVKPDDRVEFGGQLVTPELRELKVKDFLARGVDSKAKFHIVSKPGGAALNAK